MRYDPGSDIAQYLEAHARKTLLRFITCGSVDDGKSTLIGRLLYEAKQLFDDQLTALASESRKYGTQNGQLDFALLVDGLAAEREQGITIDVAYRFFSTEKREFIVADTPGHEQYTRNMVTGASTADVAVILVDARAGLLTQTRRHSFLVSLLGIRNVALAVNKMDLVDYDEAVFRKIEAEYRSFAKEVGLESVTAIPVSALRGDNIMQASDAMPWHQGPTLIDYLENVPVQQQADDGAFRLPVQWVNRPNQDFRGYAGTVVSGRIAVGDAVRVLPSGREAAIAHIVGYECDLEHAVANQAVTLVLDREVDVSRGDVLVKADAPAEVADQFEAHIVWMADAPLLRGRQYLMKLGAQSVNASVTDIKYQVNVNSLERLAAKTLPLNGIGICNLQTDRPVVFDPYTVNRDMGGFILIDRITYATVAAGMLHFALRRSSNIHVQHIDIDKRERARIKGQAPGVVWLTGLSGSGKSTIANRLEQHLHAQGYHTYILDGDNVRHGLNKDLGFTDADRVENIRRVAEVAKLMVDAGLVVITAFISPFREERRMARDLFAAGEFMEVYVDTPLAVAEQRDPKGLYKKARAGQLKNFTGIDSPYEAPETPTLRLRAAEQPLDEMVAEIVRLLAARPLG
ncbi:sulfate adenylyltransferase subunit CysN [Achromobacter aloeverae]|uniref:Multifunctional fusion protein n=1 Tax=Achromobacter aloeverae TaxID=1750518 RepID=A0A4Q1HHC9_9BURK|nr:sulfate adenylyltransferase subunit CysN [Achromobacter aloeverae]RXN86779.1 adenylyl-sulfate kinase [Achromobacter aloeverae]